jgi:hypothetical protein
MARRCKSVISISVFDFIKLASAFALATRFICQGSNTPPIAQVLSLLKYLLAWKDLQDLLAMLIYHLAYWFHITMLIYHLAYWFHITMIRWTRI